MGAGPVTDWTDEQPTLELVKQTVTMAEVAEMLGYDPDLNDKIRPPWNEQERTPSCQLYEDHFFDFASGRWGDFVDFIQAIDPDISHSQAIWMVWNKALRVGKEPGDVDAQPVRQLLDFTLDLEQHQPLNGLDPYGRRSGGGVMLVPHREPGRVYGVKTRSPGGAKGAWPGSQFTHRLYHPYGWVLDGNRTEALICEGESDAWALTETLPGIEVFALPSGASSWKDHWLKDLERYEIVWVCTDNDKAGKDARDKLSRKIGFGRVEQLRVPALYNDARDAIEAGWTPDL